MLAVPGLTARARLRLPRGAAAECALNTATVLALCFRDEESLFSGGYDAAVTVWRLPPPPRPREIRDATAECLTCPAAASCSKARLKSAVVGNSDRGGGQCRSAPPRQAQEQHRGVQPPWSGERGVILGHLARVSVSPTGIGAAC